MALSLGTTVHKIPESIAIGLLSGRLAPSRKAAFWIIALLQITMGLGGILSVTVGRVDINWAGVFIVPAAAFLLLFGILALEQEWRAHGRLSAARAAATGILCCGLAALAQYLISSYH
jgi:zinc transporter ZupT